MFITNHPPRELVLIAAGLIFSILTVTIACADTETNLMADYPLNGDAADATGNGFDGTVSGPAPAVDRWGRAGTALLFDGVDDLVDLPTPPRPPFPLTLSAWIQLDSLSVLHKMTIFTNDVNSTTMSAGVYFGVQSTGKLVARYANGEGASSSSRKSRIADVPLNVGSWYHVAVTIIASSNIHLYVDGAEVSGTYSGGATFLGYQNDSGAIGQSVGRDEPFPGTIDNVRVYDRALSLSDIEELYQSNVGRTAKLVPAEYSSIAEALAASVFGDTIYVDPGTYAEPTLIIGDGIQVRSTSDIEMPVIAAQDSVAISIANCTAGVGLKGFTVEVADAFRAFGLVVQSSSLLIQGCRFTPSDTVRTTNALSSDSSSLVITASEFSGFRGSVIYSSNDVLELDSVLVTGNSVGSGSPSLIETFNSSVSLVGSSFVSNSNQEDRSRVLLSYDGSVNLDSCIFDSNFVGTGGAISLYHIDGASILNCTISNNSADGGPAGLRLNTCANATLSGCTFAGNQISSPDSTYVSGGAIEIVGGNTSFVQCDFANNSASSLAYSFGGGVAARHADLSFADCEFRNCSADYGGAVEVENGSTVDFENTRFLENLTSKGWGGAVRMHGSSASFRFCDLDSNSAYGGGAIQGYNPALDNTKDLGDDGSSRNIETMAISATPYNKALADTTLALDCLLENCNGFRNSSVSEGGFLVAKGYAVVIDGGQYNENRAEAGSYSNGGTVWVEESVLAATGATFSGNQVENYGAAIELYHCNADTNLISNCSFDQNIGGKLGVIYATNSLLSIDGSDFTWNDASALYANNSSVSLVATDITDQTHPNHVLRFKDCTGDSTRVENCLIANNSGVALRLDASTVELTGSTIASNAGRGINMAGGSSVEVSRTIIYGNADEAVGGGALDTLTLSCSDLYANDGNYAGLAEGLLGTAGNISASPEFCGQLSGDFSLADGSPCAEAHSAGCGLIGALNVGCMEAPPHLLRIEPDGTGDAPTIQDAVLALADGDTIFLADGTFSGIGNRDVLVSGKTLFVVSESGDPFACVIDCELLGRAFDFDGSDRTLSVEGVSIIHGSADNGAAVYSANGNIHLEKCLVAENVSSGSSGGDIVFAANGNLEISGCTIAGNVSPICAVKGSPISSIAGSIVAYHDGEALAGIGGPISCTNIYGNGTDWGPQSGLIGVDGNMSVIPRFCDLSGGDFNLAQNSPCAEANSGTCGLIGALPVACGPIRGDRIVVQADGSGDFPTISDAVLAAADGDTIVLADGVFRGPGNVDVSLVDKRLAIVSASGEPDSCRIDCEQTGPFLTINSGGSAAVLLSGLEISNGFGSDGGAIRVDDGSLSVVNCRLMNNSASANGGAIWIASGYHHLSVRESEFSGNSAGAGGGALSAGYNFPGTIDIQGTTFSSNSCTYYGGAIYLIGTTEGRLVLSNSTFQGNSATYSLGGKGAALDLNIQSTISACLFFENSCKSGSSTTGSIVRFYNKDAVISNCTFADNELPGIVIHDGSNSSAAIVIENTIIANNGIAVGANFHQENTVSISCTDIYGNEGGNWVLNIAEFENLDGNLEVDPFFCSDYMLSSNSPCAPQSGSCGLIGALGVGCGEGGRDYVLRPDGTGDFATIQDAIDVAPTGIIIKLEPGTYAGPGNSSFAFLGKEVTVVSADNSPSDCLIDCGAGTGGIVFTGGETANTILDGVTLLNGSGKVLSVTAADPLVRNCIIRDNDSGGADLIEIDSAAVMFESCTIHGNDCGTGNLISMVNGSVLALQLSDISQNVCNDVLGDDGSGSVTAACVNLWANGGGDWSGAMASAFDRTCCISKDPDYCGSDLSYSDYSHLLPFESTWTCSEPIGATGVGCYVTPDSLVVAADGSGLYPNIAAAIAAAENGDVILLENGIYRGPGNRDIDLSGKLITVMSRSGIPDSCVIDCQASETDQHGAFIAVNGETRKTVVSGLTLRNGYRATYPADSTYLNNVGGALFCWNSYPLLKNCIVENNVCQGAGCVHYNLRGVEFELPPGKGNSDAVFKDEHAAGAAWESEAYSVGDPMVLVVEDCLIRGGSAISDTGQRGIYVLGDVDLIVRDCVFSGNNANPLNGSVVTGSVDTGATSGASSVFVERCVFSDNGHGSALVFGVAKRVVYVNNTFVRNTYTDRGSLLGDLMGASNIITGFDIQNNILYENSYVNPINNLNPSVPPNIACNVLFGNTNGDFIGEFAGLEGVNGNMVADPLFCDLDHGVYTVDVDSPCLQHPNGCGPVGALGAGCGASGVGETPLAVIPWKRVPLEAGPNPFNPKINFKMRGLAPGRIVDLKIYDVRGYLVFALKPVVNGNGDLDAVWNGRDNQGRVVKAGLYLCRATSDGEVKTKKIMLIK